jgi:hypothetical protein
VLPLLKAQPLGLEMSPQHRPCRSQLEELFPECFCLHFLPCLPLTFALFVSFALMPVLRPLSILQGISTQRRKGAKTPRVKIWLPSDKV